MKPTWIKICDRLGENPKVLRIAKLISKGLHESALTTRTGNTDLLGDRLVTISVTVTRDVTIASLLRVWSNIASNGRYETAPSDSNTLGNVSIVGDLETIDTLAGVPGFGKAMASVGWLQFDRERELLFFPNFLEYNVLRHGMNGGKTEAANKAANKQAAYRERQRLKKEAELAAGAAGSVTAPVTGNTEVTPPVTNEVTPPQIEIENLSLSSTTTTTARPRNIGDVLMYAEAQRRSDTTGKPLTDEIAGAWFDSRTAAGWQERKDGHEYDIADWRSDLRKFARHWHSNERNRPNKPDQTPTVHTNAKRL